MNIWQYLGWLLMRIVDLFVFLLNFPLDPEGNQVKDILFVFLSLGFGYYFFTKVLTGSDNGSSEKGGKNR
ncbi:MAG: hypothetical protein PHU05_02290 [Bacilli bacterium]|nr:hypothetical protein [Bacilli bacterium]